jgi:hypothetical protein
MVTRRPGMRTSAPVVSGTDPTQDLVTAQHYNPPKSTPRPGPGALTPTERLYLPPALPKHLRRDLVNSTTQPGSHAVMFQQTAASAKVTADSLVLEDVPIDTVWFMNRPDRYGTAAAGAGLATRLGKAGCATLASMLQCNVLLTEPARQLVPPTSSPGHCPHIPHMKEATLQAQHLAMPHCWWPARHSKPHTWSAAAAAAALAPSRRTGTVPTGALLAMLLMPTADRAISGHHLPARQPPQREHAAQAKSATVSLWAPQYRWAGCAVWRQGSEALAAARKLYRRMLQPGKQGGTPLRLFHHTVWSTAPCSTLLMACRSARGTAVLHPLCSPAHSRGYTYCTRS